MDWMGFVGPDFITRTPTNWLVLSSPNYQTVWLSPALSTTQKMYANIAVGIHLLADDMRLEQFIAMWTAQLPENYEAFDTVAQTTIKTESGLSALQYHYAITNNGLKVRQRLTFFNKDHFVHAFTDARPVENSPSVAKEVDTVFDTILYHFRYETVTLEI